LFPNAGSCGEKEYTIGEKMQGKFKGKPIKDAMDATRFQDKYNPHYRDHRTSLRGIKNKHQSYQSSSNIR
jgi:hypothetical protein